MPPSHQPPESQPTVKVFDPLELDRSVIAIPLLRKMEEELRGIEAFRAAHPFPENGEFNTLIEYNREFDGKPEEMRELVVKMAEEAAAKALEASKKRVEESKGMAPAGTRGTPVRGGSTRSRADIYGNPFLMEQRRDQLPHLLRLSIEFSVVFDQGIEFSIFGERMRGPKSFDSS